MFKQLFIILSFISELSYHLNGSPLMVSPLGVLTAVEGLEGMMEPSDSTKIYEAIWSKFIDKNAPPTCIIASSFGNETTICGIQMYSIKGRPISAFMGIKYGLAERFKPPKPAGKYWKGKLIAYRHGPICSQMELKTQTMNGEEDCLYLNVFVPKVVNRGVALSVKVFVHGGAFLEGSSNLYSPSFLLDKDVILVTINYRLGPLGFFTLNNNDAPGNIALYDQLEALKWVQEHISDFGGNKNRVTLAGQSAGAGCSNFLMLTPLSKGLFHRVILQSGTAIEKWSISKSPLRDSLELVETVGCPANASLRAIFNCMKKSSADILFPALLSLIANDRLHGKLGLQRSSPVIQSAEIDNPIITRHPKILIEENMMIDLPLMLGATKDEGSYALGVSYLSYLKPLCLDKNTEFLKKKIITDYFIEGLLEIEDLNGALSKSFQSLYCRGIDLGDFFAAAPCLNDLLGVLMFKAGIEEVARQHSRNALSSAYLYSFNAESNHTLFDFIVGKVDFDTGVSHGDDLMYIFPLIESPNERYFAIKDRMIELWTNFVIYGEPTPYDRKPIWESLYINKWNPYNFVEQNFMAMAENFSLKNNYVDNWSSGA